MPKLLITVGEEEEKWLRAKADRKIIPGGISEFVRRALAHYRRHLEAEEASRAGGRE